jgi:hypothetical protein
MPMLFSLTIGAAITAGYWFPAGALPDLPHYWRRRSADARLAPRRGRDLPYPVPVVSIVSAERAVRPTPVPIDVERGRGLLCGAQRQQVGERVK